MKKLQLEHRHAPVRYTSYIIGFVLSIAATLLAYYIATSGSFTGDAKLYLITGVALVQLFVQVVFFLHIGRGSHWKLITFLFTAFFVLILVVGTIWVMKHLDYNMMNMSSEDMHQYMEENEGI